MFPKMCKLKMGEVHWCKLSLFQGSLGINALHFDAKRFRQHHIRAELVQDLPVAVSWLGTPISTLGQLHQFWVICSILQSQVCQLPDHDSREAARSPEMEQLAGQWWLRLFQAICLFQSCGLFQGFVAFYGFSARFLFQLPAPEPFSHSFSKTKINNKQTNIQNGSKLVAAGAKLSRHACFPWWQLQYTTPSL